MGTDSPVCSLGITTISPGVNALRLHGWCHPILSYLFLVLFFHSAYQPFSWCWCGPDTSAPTPSLLPVPPSPPPAPSPPSTTSSHSSFGSDTVIPGQTVPIGVISEKN